MLPWKLTWKVKSWRGYVHVKSEIISYESFKTHAWTDILLFNKEITPVWEGESAKLQWMNEWMNMDWSREREHEVAKPETQKADVMNQVIINLWFLE